MIIFMVKGLQIDILNRSEKSRPQTAPEKSGLQRPRRPQTMASSALNFEQGRPQGHNNNKYMNSFI